MLKKRIIPLQLLKRGRLVKSVRFDGYRDVGDPVKSSAVYSDQQADELIILNIEAEKGIAPLLDIVDALAEVCFMPLTLGGGVRTFEDAEQLISRGADKVFVNTLCYDHLDVVTKIAARFGRQAVVAGVDFTSGDSGIHFDPSGSNTRSDISQEKPPAEPPTIELFSADQRSRRRIKRNIPLRTHLLRLQEAGVGEVLLQSIDLDGSMSGFNTALVNDIAQWIDLPLLVAGGAGHYEHLRTLFLETEASGAVCGSLFNFSDSNPMRARAHLLNYGLPLKSV